MRRRSAIHFSENDVNRSDTGHHVGNQPAHDELGQGLQIHEGRRANVDAQRLGRPVARDKNAQFAARRLDGLIGLAGGRRETFGENLEMVDAALLRQVFGALFRNQPAMAAVN